MSDDFDEQLFRAVAHKFVGRLPEQVVLDAMDQLRSSRVTHDFECVSQLCYSD